MYFTTGMISYYVIREFLNHHCYSHILHTGGYHVHFANVILCYSEVHDNNREQNINSYQLNLRFSGSSIRISHSTTVAGFSLSNRPSGVHHAVALLINYQPNTNTKSLE